AKPKADQVDPGPEADRFLANLAAEGSLTLRFWQESFWRWRNGAYEELTGHEIQGMVTRHLNQTYSQVGSTVVNNVIMQAKAHAYLASDYAPPCWLKGDDPWADVPGVDLLPCRNGILNLPLAAKRDSD